LILQVYTACNCIDALKIACLPPLWFFCSRTGSNWLRLARGVDQTDQSAVGNVQESGADVGKSGFGKRWVGGSIWIYRETVPIRHRGTTTTDMASKSSIRYALSCLSETATTTG